MALTKQASKNNNFDNFFIAHWEYQPRSMSKFKIWIGDLKIKDMSLSEKKEFRCNLDQDKSH